VGVKKVWSEDNHCDMWQADYRVKIPLPKKDSNEKQKYKHKRIRKLYHTKPMAERAIRTDKVKAEKGEYVEESKVTLKDWKEKVMNYVNAQRHGSTPRTYKHTLNEFLYVIGEKREVDSLDRNDFRKYIDYLTNQGVTENTVRTYYSKIQAAINLTPLLFDSLLSWQPITPAFSSVVDHKAFATRQPRARSRFLEVDEIEKMFKALERDVDIRDIFICALNTGGRLREILSLTWDRVLWNERGYKNGALKLRVTKIRGVPESFRIIPITDEIISLLKRRQINTSSPYIFPSLTDQNKPRPIVWRELKDACKEAGIIYGQKEVNGFVFRDLRRTSVTYLRRAGVDIENVCAITGHSPAIMLEVYSRTSPQSQQNAIDKLAAILPSGQLKVEAEIEIKEKAS
jgi:integrase